MAKEKRDITKKDVGKMIKASEKGDVKQDKKQHEKMDSKQMKSMKAKVAKKGK